jgi:hypothetical protein
VCDDPEAKTSVHAPVSLGAFAFLRTPKLLHLLRRALAEHLRRDGENGQATLFPGLPLALLVLLRVGVLADELLPSVYEMRELSQVLIYEVGVRPQFIKTLPTVPQGGQLALRFGPPLVELAQVRSQLL